MTAGYEDPQRRRGTAGKQSRQSRLRADDDSTELEYNRFVARTSAEALRMGRELRQQTCGSIASL